MALVFNYHPDGRYYTIGQGSTYDGALTIPSTTGEDSLPVLGIEDNAFYGCQTLTSVTIENGIYFIGNYAFRECRNLITVDASAANIRYVGYSAFTYCTSLTTAILPGAVDGETYWWGENFYGCTNLTTINLPNNLNEIRQVTFHGCEKLNNITVPSNVKKIGYKAFYSCKSLVNLIFEPSTNLTSIENEVFRECRSLINVDLSNLTNLTEISYACFYNCVSLVDIIFPNNIIRIGDYAFSSSRYIWGPCGDGTLGQNNGGYCSSLTFNGRNAIPNSVTIIGSYAFEGTKIVSAIMPDTVTYLGEGAFYSCRYLKYANIPTGVAISDNGEYGSGGLKGAIFYNCINLESNIVFPEGLQRIYGSTLAYCTKITNITLPSTLKYLHGDSTFSGTGITNIVLPEGLIEIGNWVFSMCQQLVTINLPNSLTTIGFGTFYYCTKLEGITLPPNLNALRFTFPGCSSLTYVNIPGTCKRIEYNSFSSCINLANVTINNGVETIESSAFYGCKKLTTLNLPNSIREISNYAFSNCGLTTINIPPLINKINYGVFYACKDLKNITIPSNIISILDNAFSFSGLENITLPISVEYLGSYAFSYCLNLNSISIQNDNMVFGKNIFYGATLSNFILGDFNYSFAANKATIKAYRGIGEILDIPYKVFDTTIYNIGDSAFKDNTNLKEINFSSPIEVILDSAFKNCINLSKITLPKSITSIGANSFYGCTSLNGELKLPKKLISIGNYAFYGCNNISSLLVQNSVTTIGDYAFANCSKLNLIYFYGNCPTFGSNVFNNINSQKVFLRYRDRSGWDNVSQQISPLSYIIYSLVKSSKVTSKSGNKKSFIVKVENLSTINVFKSKRYLFKSATNNSLSQIFNPSLFNTNDIIGISSESSPNDPFIKFQKSLTGAWLNLDSQENSNNYSIPNNSILTFSTFRSNIAIGGNAIIQKYPSGRIKVISTYPTDQDSLNYVLNVENADGERLEEKTKTAMNDFIVGCKNDGIWTSIKESCLIGGARTLNGALIPLVGNEPTNINFVSSDYDRRIGIRSNYGDLKALKAGSRNLDYARDNVHAAVYVTQPLDIWYDYLFFYSVNSRNIYLSVRDIELVYFRLRLCSSPASEGYMYWNPDWSTETFSGLVGMSKPDSSSIKLRLNGIDYSKSLSSCPNGLWKRISYLDGDIYLLTQNPESTNYWDFFPGIIGFYSLGEDIDLAKLENRLKIYFDAIKGIED